MLPTLLPPILAPSHRPRVPHPRAPGVGGLCRSTEQRARSSLITVSLAHKEPGRTEPSLGLIEPRPPWMPQET